MDPRAKWLASHFHEDDGYWLRVRKIRYFSEDAKEFLEKPAEPAFVLFLVDIRPFQGVGFVEQAGNISPGA